LCFFDLTFISLDLTKSLEKETSFLDSIFRLKTFNDAKVYFGVAIEFFPFLAYLSFWIGCVD